MCKKLLSVMLGMMFLSSLVIAGDYYLVKPNNKMIRAEKRGDIFVPVKGAREIETAITFGMEKGFIDTVQLFEEMAGYYFPDRDSNTISIQLFNSDYACSLLAFGANFYSEGWGEFSVWEGPDPIPPTTAQLLTEMETVWAYDSASNSWTGTPTVLFGPTAIGSDDPGELLERTCWVDISPNIDIGTNAVWCGWRMLTQHTGSAAAYGGKPWPSSDKYAELYGPHYAPCRTWMFRIQDYPSDIRGWIDYGDDPGDWGFFYVIDIYANAPPSFQAYDKLPGTYITAGRTVTADLYDFGVPSDSSGVASASIHYWTAAAPEDTIEVPMVLDSGDIIEGTWEEDIPGQSAWTTVTYYLSATDLQGLTKTTSEISYTVGAGTPGNVLVLLEGDAYYGPPYSSVDAISRVVGTDVWDEWDYGKIDASIIDFYTTGEGQKGIFWIAWSGFSFVEDTTLIASFLDAGGNLFISSEDLVGGGFDLGYVEGVVIPSEHWVYRYLGIKGVFDDYNTDSTFTVYGMAGDPITDDFQAGIEVSPYYWAGPGYNFTGRFDSLDAGATLIFMDGVGANLAYRYESAKGGYKLVNLYWPFHYIGTYVEEDLVSQTTLMQNVKDWFGLVGVEEKTPTGIYCLHNATPNPFGKNTVIKYAIPNKGKVSLKVYDITGSLVNTILDKEVPAGFYTAQWNGRDSRGRKVSSGVYFYRLEAGNFKVTRKVALVR